VDRISFRSWPVLCHLALAISVMSIPASYGQELRQSSFNFPGDGTPNKNQSIGPFCCTGETATVRTTDDKAVGYIYFYSWNGQAITKSDDSRSFVPDVEILVSGLADPSKPDSEQVKSSVPFKASEMIPGATGTTTAGALSFKVTVQNATLESIAGVTYAEMGSVAVAVDVTVGGAPSGGSAGNNTTSQTELVLLRESGCSTFAVVLHYHVK
jgi:hypothetical protein